MENLFIKLSTTQQYGKIININFEDYCLNNKYNKEISEKGKLEVVHYVYDKFFKNFPDRSAIYYFYGMNFQKSIDVEIFAKVVFMLIYNKYGCNKNKNCNKLYIAIDFENNIDYAKEFIRIFSIFYSKQGKSEYMENVQIAVCSSKCIDNKGKRSKNVNFILAGKDLARAYETANNFVYYNADASLEFVSLLKYLKSSIESEIVPIFPFDLYLKGRGNDTNASCWFIQDMKHRLVVDLWSKDYGCKISDVSVRVGSKIKINTFYEAELLFHNAGTVKRFAYLIAQDIINTINVNRYNFEGKCLFLLAYENYSAVLIQEIKRLLEEYADDVNSSGKNWYDKNNIFWVLDVRNHINLPSVSFDRISKGTLKSIIDKAKEIQESKKDCATQESKDGCEAIDCVTVVPINSTMSTMYKLHNSFVNGLELKCKEIYGDIGLSDKKTNIDFLFDAVNFDNNYCLVAVGKAFDTFTLDEIENRYICSFSDKAKNNDYRIAILINERNDKSKAKVKFFISVPSKWEDIQDFNNNDKPLLQVDKTSTLIDTYFQSNIPEKAIEYYNTDDTNEKK